MARSFDELSVLNAALRLEARVTRAATARRLFDEAEAGVALGAYRLLRRIGEGGTGLVFEALDSRTGQRVAIKVLRREGADGVRHLRREFRSVAELDHPNLVQLYELADEGELSFIAMELVEGCSLREYVTAGDALDLERLRDAMAQLVDAVSSLHAAGLLHRDLKPANVLVEPSGRVVMLDFDLARPFGELTPTNCSGTPPYVAPERLRGLPYQEASDWYSVGVMLHEALTGQLPAPRAAEPNAAALSLVHEETHDATAFFALCDRLLSEHARERPSSAELRSWFGLPTTSRPSSPVRATGSTGILIGREGELAELRAAFALSARGKRVLVHIQGEPGIGKTALVKHFCEEMQAWYGATILSGRCYEGDLIPFNAVEGLFDDLRRALARFPEIRPALTDVEALKRVFPALARALDEGPGLSAEADVHSVRQRAFTALRALLHALAEPRPLLIHLDDLQWGDSDSAQLLHALFHGAAPGPLLVLASYRRSAEQTPCVSTLRAVTAEPLVAIDIDVGPLAEVAARNLALRLSEGVASERLLNSLNEAHGNPLFLRALVDHAKHVPGDDTLSLSFQQIVLAALARLPSPCRALLELTALATRPIERELLLRAANALTPDPAWPNHLAQLQRAGLVRGAPGNTQALETCHDRVRETLGEMIEGEQRKQYHGELAAAEAVAANPDPEFLAYHCAGADQDERAAHFAELCGDRAFNAVALERAADFYQMALTHLAGKRPAALLEKLANAIAFAGRWQEAAALYLETARSHRDPAVEALRLRLRAAEMLIRAGKFEEGLAVAQPVLKAVGIRYPKSIPGALVSLVATVARTELVLRVPALRGASVYRTGELALLRNDACFSIGYRLSIADPIRGSSMLAKTLLHALRAGTPEQLARGLGCHALMLAQLEWSSSKRQDELLLRGAEIAENTGDPETIGWALYFYARTMCSRGDFAQSIPWNDRTREWVTERCIDAQWMLRDLDSGACIAMYFAGKIGRLGELPRPVKLAADMTDTNPVNDLTAPLHCFLFIARDRAECALDELERIVPDTDTMSSSYFTGLATWVTLHAYLYLGDTNRAEQVMRTRVDTLKRTALRYFACWKCGLPWLEATVALACAQNGDSGDHLKTVRRCIGTLSKQRAQFAVALRTLVEAGLASLEGRQSDAARMYNVSAEHFEGLSMLGYASAARVREAELIGGSETPQLAAARAWFHSEGVANPERWLCMYAPIDRPPAKTA